MKYFAITDIPDQDHHDDVLTGEHSLVIIGTNVDLSQADSPWPSHDLHILGSLHSGQFHHRRFHLEEFPDGNVNKLW